MNTELPVADLDYIRYEAVNFNLDRPDAPPHLIYHFTRQRRKPQMKIQAVDRLGFCAALITEGKAVFEYLGQTVPLQQGSVFLRRQNVPYRFYKTDPDELELIMIMFDPSIKPLWSRLIKPDCAVIRLRNSTKIIELTRTVFDLLEQNPENRIERANAFAPLFLEMIAAEELQASGQLSPETERVEKCRHYIHENFRSIRHMDEPARACRISRNHLYTLFRRHMQTTPKKYLDQLKTAAAAELLTQTDWTMERIAEETGYADAPTLSKAFKRRNGVSPAEWRRNTAAFAH